MKTREFAETLAAYAGLADFGRAVELRKFADFFSKGKDETIVSRLKTMSRATGHPTMLKQSLEIIQAGFKVAGAKKQATEVGIVLGAFAGQNGAAIDAFIAEISVAPSPKKKTPPPPPMPDYRLARDLADELARTLLDTQSFSQVIVRLRDTKGVNAPTLAMVANRFLGNDKQYKGRKTPIDDILKRQKADAREHARGKALNRVGV